MRYRFQDRSTVGTEAMRIKMQKAIRKIEQLMKDVPMFRKHDGKPLELIGIVSSLSKPATAPS